MTTACVRERLTVEQMKDYLFHLSRTKCDYAEARLCAGIDQWQIEQERRLNPVFRRAHRYVVGAVVRSLIPMGELLQIAVNRAKTRSDTLLIFLLKSMAPEIFDDKVRALMLAEEMEADAAEGKGAGERDAARQRVIERLKSMALDKVTVEMKHPAPPPASPPLPTIDLPATDVSGDPEG